MVEKLRFSWDEVHEVAEQLEHIHSEILIERLDQLLGYPKFDPHGDPIPDKNGKMPLVTAILLSDAKVGTWYKISGVVENSDRFLKYLNKLGLAQGSSLIVREFEEYDGSMKLALQDDSELVLSKEAAANLYVS